MARNTAQLAAGLAALLVLVASFLLRIKQGCTFVEVAPGVHRCSQWHFLGSLSPVLVQVEEPAGLLGLFKKHRHHWILVDAGDGDSWLGSYASRLVQGVKRALAPPRGKGRNSKASPGTLDLIVLTHAHPDHVGALPQLLEAYPDAKVVTHIEELRFVAGPSPASHFEGLGLVRKLFRAVGGQPIGVPVDRLLHLHGEEGDVAAALHGSGAAQGSYKWLPRGVLRYIHIPGHAPGHLALLHQPSSTLLPGDAVIPSLASRLLPWVNCLSTPAGISSSCPDTVKPRAKQLLEQESYRLVLPYHGGAYTQEQARAAVASWPAGPLERCRHEAAGPAAMEEASEIASAAEGSAGSQEAAGEAGGAVLGEGAAAAE